MSAIHVETTGVGPPLVLLHGWAMHGGLFASLVPRLARRFRVHQVDLPGHGHSAALDAPTLDAVVDAIDAKFRDSTQPLSVLGWSLGGTVALRWARLQPGRVARLILVGTTPRFVAGPDWPHAMAPEVLARFGDELAVACRLTLQRFLTLQIQGGDAGRRALGVLREQIFARGEPNPVALGASLAIFAAADLREDARRVDAPACLIAGACDRLTPPAASAWLAQAMPDARFVEIPGAAHAPFLSHPVAFDAALDGCLHAC